MNQITNNMDLDLVLQKYSDQLKKIWNTKNDSNKKTTAFYVQQLVQVLEGAIVPKANDEISTIDENEVEKYIRKLTYYSSQITLSMP